jgi:hypothetical protein
MAPPETKKKKIGFMAKEKQAAYGCRGVKRKKAKREGMRGMHPGEHGSNVDLTHVLLSLLPIKLNS